MNNVNSTKSKKITVSIFYHIIKEPSEREYWIGTETSDGSCDTIITNISGKGASALKSAIAYIDDL